MAKAAWAGLILVLTVIVFSVAIRLGAENASAGLMLAMRGVHRVSASAECRWIALVWLA
jgi:hypothetical protein